MIGSAASRDQAAQASVGADGERVGSITAGEILDVGEGCPIDGAGILTRDRPGIGGVGSNQRVRAGPAEDGASRDRGARELERVGPVAAVEDDRQSERTDFDRVVARSVVNEDTVGRGDVERRLV